MVFGDRRGPLGIVHPLLAEVPQRHLLLHNLFIMGLESAFLSAPHFAIWILRLETYLQANLKVRNGLSTPDPSVQLVKEGRRDALIARQVDAYNAPSP